jgi:hypothetical protein
MPIQVRKLSDQEAARAFARRGRTVLAAGVAALRRLHPGEAAAVALGPLSARAAKRRLGRAAQQAGYRLRWARADAGATLHVQVLAAGPPSTPSNGRRRGARTATASARPGRPAEAPRSARRGRRGQAAASSSAEAAAL